MRPSVPPFAPSSVPPPAPPASAGGTIAASLRELAEGAKPSEVWRAAACALLRLNPRECDALALVFEDEAVTDEVRTLVLDLLAGAGTFEAQVVIRRVLALAIARKNNRTFASYVHRLGALECPDGPSLRFLMSVYAESRGEPHDVRAACAYALGAAAGGALVSGDPDAAVRASDVLRRDLLSAGSVIEKCQLLTALGNAGVPTDVMVVTRFTQDKEAPVRAAAALALRKMNLPEARAHLVAMLADKEARVGESALVALSDQKLDDDELEKLAELILAGRTAPALDARILRFIVAQRPKLTSVPGRAGAIENALRMLLGRVEANDSLLGALSVGAGKSISGERRIALPSSQQRMPAASAASPSPSPSPASSGAVPVAAPLPPPGRRAAGEAPVPVPLGTGPYPALPAQPVQGVRPIRESLPPHPNAIVRRR